MENANNDEIDVYLEVSILSARFFPMSVKQLLNLLAISLSINMVWLFTFILLGAIESCFGLFSRLLILSHVFLMSLLYLLNSL